MDIKELQRQLEARRDDMVADMVEMSSIPAINPRMGGGGEYARMRWIMRWFERRKIPCELYEVPDDAVPEGVRLNVIVTIPGRKYTDRSLWFISHVDTVNTGDLAMWDTDPMHPVVKDGRIYGLGCEDNSQSVITTMYTCALLFENDVQIDRNLRFYYAADEETGSVYGMKALLDKGLIREGDEAIVPDGGSKEGNFVEIAEKSQVWLKFTVNGKTAHAAMPQLGVNASFIGMKFAVELEESLKACYDRVDPMFDPPESTFEVTQKFANVSSPNVLPGKDEFCMDMRILPDYPVDEVMAFIHGIMEKYERQYDGLRIGVEFLTRTDAPAPTSPDSQVVRALVAAISETGVKAYSGGIGGGTCGAILRARNIPAVIWAKLDDMCHSPNEYVIIDNMVHDAKIYISVIGRFTD